jgi:hypothetical protein
VATEIVTVLEFIFRSFWTWLGVFLMLLAFSRLYKDILGSIMSIFRRRK